MHNSEAFIKKIRAVDMGKHGLYTTQANAIFEANTGDTVGIMLDAFRYGFLLGEKSVRGLARQEEQ